MPVIISGSQTLNTFTKVDIKHYQTSDMTVYFNTIQMEIATYPGIKRPELNKNGSFNIIYSPEKFKLRPRDSKFLDWKFKLTTPKRIEIFINLLPSLKEQCLDIENHPWVSNTLKDGTIQLEILNKSFYNTINIKKNQEIAYIFLMNQNFNEKIVSSYNIIS